MLLSRGLVSFNQAFFYDEGREKNTVIYTAEGGGGMIAG